MEPPTYPEIWQCLGMVIGVYGLLYAVAATDRLGQWPIVAVGLLGKLLGPIGFLYAALQDTLPWVAGLTILTNDLIWWIPFSLILWRAWTERERPPVRTPAPEAAPSVVSVAGGDGHD